MLLKSTEGENGYEKEHQNVLTLGLMTLLVGCEPEEEKTTEEEFEEFMEDTKKRKEMEAEIEDTKQYFDALDAFIELEEDGY